VKESTRYLKKRIDVRCSCKGASKRNSEKDRIKFGTSKCDSFSLNYTLNMVISNYLYQYLADAKEAIIRDDWEDIEKCANAIRSYATIDKWDGCSYEGNLKEYKDSMEWLTNNMPSLWW
jgi:hypothetical protein